MERQGGKRRPSTRPTGKKGAEIGELSHMPAAWGMSPGRPAERGKIYIISLLTPLTYQAAAATKTISCCYAFLQWQEHITTVPLQERAREEGRELWLRKRRDRLDRWEEGTGKRRLDDDYDDLWDPLSTACYGEKARKGAKGKKAKEEGKDMLWSWLLIR